jgi:hypothetical protein
VVLAASINRANIDFIVLLMEAGSISETSVNFYKTAWSNIPHTNEKYALLHLLTISMLGVFLKYIYYYYS